MLSFLTDERIVLYHGFGCCLGFFFAILQALKIVNEKFEMQDSFLPAVVGRVSIILSAFMGTA